MQCLLSNAVPQQPVVAKPCGCLFDRALIERYIDEHQKCPITGERLTREDLLPVKAANTGVGCSSVTDAASVPGLLQRLSAEWEANMLETFKLRTKLAQMTQELAMSLHQNEAAYRVIATLQKECDALRSSSNNSNGGDAAVVVVPPVMQKCIDEQEAQQKQRRKADAAAGNAQAGCTISKVGDIPLPSGTTALCVHAVGNHLVYAAGTSPRHELLQIHISESNRAPLVGIGHTAPIHTITSTTDGSRVITAAADSTVCVWQATASALVCAHTLRYPSRVTALSRGLIGQRFVLSATEDGTVYMSDIHTGVHVVTAPSGLQCAITTIQIHPFGSMAVMGTSRNEFVLYNTRMASVDTIVKLPAASGVASVDVSSDCRHVAVGLTNGQLLLWDLKSTEKPVAVVNSPGGDAPASVSFSSGNNGRHIAVAAAGTVSMYETQRLIAADITAVFSDKTSAVSRSVCWGEGLAAACSMDGVVHVYTAATA